MIPEDNLVSGHVRNHVDPDKFNQEAMLPYSLRLLDFEIAIQDVSISSTTSTDYSSSGD